MISKGTSAAPASGLNDRNDGPIDPSNQRSSEHKADIELALDDLIGDARGDIVFCNDSNLGSLAITTEAVVVEEGVAERHSVAGGMDVSGYRYVRFASGVTLYVEPGMSLVIVRGQSG